RSKGRSCSEESAIAWRQNQPPVATFSAHTDAAVSAPNDAPATSARRQFSSSSSAQNAAEKSAVLCLPQKARPSSAPTTTPLQGRGKVAAVTTASAAKSAAAGSVRGAS